MTILILLCIIAYMESMLLEEGQKTLKVNPCLFANMRTCPKVIVYHLRRWHIHHRMARFPHFQSEIFILHIEEVVEVKAS